MADRTSTDLQLSPLKQAFLALEQMEGQLDALKRARTEPIAIIGVGCRFPGGAKNPEAFWDLLYQGRDAHGEVPRARWDVDAYYDPSPHTPGKMHTRYGAFLEEAVDQFDPQFFGIAPREAHGMDPQQRLLLEVCWEALEVAAQAPDRLVGSRTGVYIGICATDYNHLYVKRDDPALLDGYYASGIAHSIASGRLSYLLGLQGPSLSLDTACSSSLLAVHLAVQSLRNDETDMALAGGVNLMLSPENSIAMSQFGMLAPDGRCKTFAAGADGFGRGEGCGVVVLKRLSDALAHGDRVMAVIRGTATNQDGPSSGLTAPYGPSQEAVIRTALAQADLDPRLISYVETHGTGTSLGDPIEVQALGNVFGAAHTPDNPLWIGSVKTNVGHMEAAAGIGGIIKVVLALQHGVIPPHLNFDEPSPFIPWARLPLRVPVQPEPWDGVEGRRIAGVSAFGFSGTNVHVILEAPDPGAQAEAVLSTQAVARPQHLLTLAAKQPPALRELALRLHDYLTMHPAADLANVCFSANAGRAHFEHRLALVADSVAEMRAKLAAFIADESSAGLFHGMSEPAEKPKIAFLFTGQGAQYVGMGRQLYETQPTFRAALERCAEILRPYLDVPLLDALYPPPGVDSPLDETTYTQPALFAFEYALAQLWQSWGIEPNFVAGHSVGEFVAATLAGVFSLEDGLRLVAERGRLMGALPAGGAMAAVLTDEATVEAAIAPYTPAVSIAAVNGPANVVISGEAATLESILAELQKAEIKTRRLNVSHAFHSALMEPMLDEFGRIAGTIHYGTPRLRLLSALTGKIVSGGEVGRADYWCRHAREAVRFASAIASLHQQGVQIFLEIGPAPILTGMGQQCLAEVEEPLLWLASLRPSRDDWSQVLGSMASLYVHGVKVNWEGFDQDYARQRLALPTYPFQRRRHWLPEAAATQRRTAPARGAQLHPLLGRRVRSPLKAHQFEVELDPAAFSFLADHRVHQMTILPGAAFMEAGLAAADAVLGGGQFAVQDLLLQEKLAVPDSTDPTRQDVPVQTVQWVVVAEESGTARFECYSQARDTADWCLHASGRLVAATTVAPPAVDLVALQAGLPETVAATAHYAQLQAKGLDFGPSLRGLSQAWRRDGEALAAIEVPECVADEVDAYFIHPALLDAHLQVLALALPEGDGVYLPFHVEDYRLYRPRVCPVWGYVKLHRPETHQGDVISGDVSLLTADGQVVGEILGIHLKRLQQTDKIATASTSYADWLYAVTWTPKPLTESQPDLPVSAPNEDMWPVDMESIQSSLDTELAELELQHGLDHYALDVAPYLDRLSLAYVLQAFRELGWNPQPGTQVTTAALAEQLRLLPNYRRLLEHLLTILAEADVVQRVGEAWQIQVIPRGEDTGKLYAEIVHRFPAFATELEIAGRCGAALAQVLRGTTDPLQLLFPKGDLTVAERLYRTSPSARAYNGLAQKAVQVLLQQRTTHATLRVLEIGGGTGGTTSHLLPILPADATAYTFTDISPLFVARAREKFADYANVNYAVLDLEKSPDSQGFGGQQFDLIVAANVVHATADLRQTLAYIHDLLAPNGLLMMIEVTGPERWVDISFGLTDGWWRFTDTELRPHYPLLSISAWRTLLLENGFESVVATPAEDGAGFIDEALILAKRAVSNSTTHAGADPHWLIFADEGGTAQRLAEQLAAQGVTTTLVKHGSHFIAEENGDYCINPVQPSDFSRLFDITTAGRAIYGVVHLWSLDAHIGEDGGLDAAQALATTSVLHLAQALAKLSGEVTPRLWLVTRGAQCVGSELAPMALAQSPLWGLGKVAALEHPELHPVLVDLDPVVHPSETSLLVRELMADDGEDQIALRGTTRLVARLAHSPLRPTGAAGADDKQLVRLEIDQRGTLEHLTLRPSPRRVPGLGEVEIRVHATGLNFKDVLNTLGMYPGDAGLLGGECAGEIVALGQGVTEFHLGQYVVAVAPGAFSSHVIAAAALVVPLPDRLTLVEAAGVPIAFITAAYTLHHLAQLQPGERVLIHAGAGGVGLAAVQLAQRAGAVIFATAGSPEKRAYLRGLGVAHVLDSRTLDFAEEILALTGGDGVDVVLNSLAGDFIPKSLSVLAPGGRFLEIGKSNLLTPEQAANLGDGRKYFIIDWSETAQRDPELIHSIFVHLMAEIGSGRLHPLPFRTFTIDNARAAFRFMAQARHIGKIVVTQPAEESRDTAAPFSLRADGTYLITGGLGGLGRLVAKWMVAHGAGHVVLVGRSAPSAEIRAELDGLAATGTTLLVKQADVSDYSQISQVIAEIDRALPPLRGVIHAAGVLDDGSLLHQTEARFQWVMGPKMAGAWHLHQLTQHRALDFFVLFSSIASLFGSPGQSNHAAANAFMDALAFFRQAQGLPGTSINWGVWSEVGIAAARNVGVQRMAQGMETIAPADGLTLLAEILKQQPAQIGVSPMRWSQFLLHSGGAATFGARPFFADMIQSAPALEMPSTVSRPGTSSDWLAQLAQESPARQRVLLLDYIKTYAGKVLDLDPATFSTRMPLSELGLDSLMAVELRNLLSEGLKLARALPATLVFDYPTVEAIGDYLMRAVLALQPAVEETKEPPASEDGLLDLLEELSDSEVDRLLAKKQ